MSLNSLKIVPEEEYAKLLSDLDLPLEPKPIQTLFPEPSPSAETVPLRVEPQPGFIVRTVTSSKSRAFPLNHSIFINVCHSPEFPKPPAVTEEEIQKALNADATTKYQIPLSLTEPRVDTDDGKSCLVFDACIHSEPYQRACQDFDFRLYVIELAIEWVEEKNQLTLRREFTLPPGGSKGQLAPHTIPVLKEAPITEFDSARQQTTKKPQPAPKAGSIRVPEYRLQELPGLSGPSKQLHLSVMLPDLVNTKTTTLDIEPEQLILDTPNMYHLEVPFPYTIDITQGRALFSRNSKVLKVMLHRLEQE
ncbi:PIH1-domain-containing protein [Basidiobolus meristosporus CBS 931.73]|uniref:PIH1 domain-containing protein 1 n=1 Tax=Basidiobolus meristosporus CBS 931.73 TaxID=1314790 RepID=A0A1Y1XZW9_9FUNG|nr:PIH1-domain-containing protein [Basidiobolus meristosporus CBS 931.73]|eukprot:ORX91297.1 PIH1-domain-containing protein [Basidiobolus meristosporus CBS 931.73]